MAVDQPSPGTGSRTRRKEAKKKAGKGRSRPRRKSRSRSGRGGRSARRRRVGGSAAGVAASPFGSGFPDWNASQALAAAAPRVCHEVGILLAQAGHTLPDADAVVPIVALLLQAKDTSDKLCGKLMEELRASKAALGTVAGWLEEAAVLQQVVDAHCLALGAKLSKAVSIKTRVTSCPSALAGVQLPEAGVLGSFPRGAPAAAAAGAAAPVVVGAATSAASGPGAALAAAAVARAAVAAAAPGHGEGSGATPVAGPAAGGKVAAAIARMGEVEVPTTPAGALPLPFNAFGGPKAAPARPFPGGWPAAAGGAATHRPVSPPRVARLQHTKTCYASEDVDWRGLVVWTRSSMPPDVAASWMQESRHKWVDIWWDLSDFGRLAEGYRGLVAPKGLASAVFNAVGRCKAVRLKGWLNVADVVVELGSMGKAKRLSAFDVFAAGVGAMGLPRDMAYAQVIIPGKKSGTFSTTVFVRATSSFVHDLAEPPVAAGSTDATPVRPGSWQDQPQQGGVWEGAASPADPAAATGWGSGDAATWNGYAEAAGPATFGDDGASAWAAGAALVEPAYGGGGGAAWGGSAESSSWNAAGRGGVSGAPSGW